MSWRLWVDVPVDEVPDYNTPLIWKRQVSEHTAKALRTAFGHLSTNQARLQVRKSHAFPNVEATKCPKLDPAAKQLLGKEQKQADDARVAATTPSASL